MKIDIKFPCGYELHAESSGFWEEMNFNSMPGCPLHGKDCPPK